MLVMKRRAGESFTIGDEIEIEVLEVAGTRVKLGIVAPDSVAIVRKEARVTREENITASRPVAPMHSLRWRTACGVQRVTHKSEDANHKRQFLTGEYRMSNC